MGYLRKHFRVDRIRMLEQKKAKESKVFCMAPWVHVHAWAGGEVYPCCLSNVGS